jgi:hypothetical protein
MVSNRASADCLVFNFKEDRPVSVSLRGLPTAFLGVATVPKPVPRDGAFTLADVRSPRLSIICECGRAGCYAVAGLIDQHGDAKLTELLSKLAKCKQGRCDGAHRCRVVYKGCSLEWL